MFLWVLCGLMTLVSCSDSVLFDRAMPEVQASTNGNCIVDQQYLDDLEVDLAAHYQIDASDVTVTYTGTNNDSNHEFPFVVDAPNLTGTGLLEIEDLCAAFSSDFIVEDDLLGI